MEMNQRKWLMLSSLALLVSISSCASFTAAEAEPIQQVIPLSNLTAAQIFTKSQLWASNTFVSAKDAIELVDKDAGIITIRTRYDAHAYSTGEALGGKYYCTYKILLEIKEGKTRMTCQNPTVEAVVNGRTTHRITSYNVCYTKLLRIKLSYKGFS